MSRSLDNNQSELLNEDVGFLDASLLEEGSCLAHDKGPLVFVVWEGLLQNEDGEKCQIDSLSIDSVAKLYSIQSLLDISVFNLAPFDAGREHRAGLEAPVTFRGLPLEYCHERWFFRCCCCCR